MILPNPDNWNGPSDKDLLGYIYTVIFLIFVGIGSILFTSIYLFYKLWEIL